MFVLELSLLVFISLPNFIGSNMYLNKPRPVTGPFLMRKQENAMFVSDRCKTNCKTINIIYFQFVLRM